MLNKRLFGFGLASLLTVGVLAVRAESDGGAIPNCPIMGEPIDFSVSTDTPDGPVYFCCGGCIKKYNANPEKYAKLVADQRKILAKRDKVQVKCPVTGEPTNPEISAKHDGKDVSFCSKGCLKKFVADPAKYKSGLANAYTYQTKCPVMGGTVIPSSFTKLPTGQTIYYCCGGCEDKFTGNLAKYAPVLAAQGININVAKITKMMKPKKDNGHDHGAHGHEGHDHD